MAEDIQIKVGIQTDDVKSKLATLKTEFESLKGKLGDNMLSDTEKNKILTRMGEIKTETSKLAEEARANSEKFAGEVGKFAGGIGAIYGAVSVLAADADDDTKKMIEQYVKWTAVIQGVKGAIEVWTSAQRILNVVMAANPIGAIVAGVIALGAAIYALSKYIGEDTKKIDENNTAFAEFIKNRKDFSDTNEKYRQSLEDTRNELNLLNGDISEYEANLTTLNNQKLENLANEEEAFTKQWKEIWKLYNDGDINFRERENQLTELKSTANSQRLLIEKDYQEKVQLLNAETVKKYIDDNDKLLESNKNTYNKIESNIKGALDSVRQYTAATNSTIRGLELDLFKESNLDKKDDLEFQKKILDLELDLTKQNYYATRDLRKQQLEDKKRDIAIELGLEQKKAAMQYSATVAQMNSIITQAKKGTITYDQAENLIAPLKLQADSFKAQSEEYLKMFNTFNADINSEISKMNDADKRYVDLLNKINAKKKENLEEAKELKDDEVAANFWRGVDKAEVEKMLENEKKKLEDEQKLIDERLRTYEYYLREMGKNISNGQELLDKRSPFSLFSDSNKDLERAQLDKMINKLEEYYEYRKSLVKKGSIEEKEITEEQLNEIERLEEDFHNRWKKRFNDGLSYMMDTSRALYDVFAEGLANSNDALISNMNHALELSIDQQSEYYKAQLDQGILTQNEYDLRMEELEAERAAKDLEIRRREFEMNKKAAEIQAAIDGASGIIKTFATLGFPAGIPAAAALGVITAAQIATINSQEAPQFEDGGRIYGPSHRSGGVDINAEGGEFMINKNSMRIPAVDLIANFLNNVRPGQSPSVNIGGSSGITRADLDYLATKINDKKVINVATDTIKINNKVNQVRNKATY